MLKMLQVSTFGELCTVSFGCVIIASVHMQYFIGHAIASWNTPCAGVKGNFLLFL